MATGNETTDGSQEILLYQFEDANAASYADLISTVDDLKFVERACERLLVEMSRSQEAQDQVVVRALWASILTTYARCFISGKRKAIPKADIQLLPLDGEVAEWHQWLIDMRNKHIAHSVNAFETVKVGVGLGPSGAVECVAHMLMRHVSTDEGGVRQTKVLARSIADLITARIVEQERAVRTAANALGSEHVSQLPAMGAVVPGAERAGSARP
jgi:hypothetical protein